MKRWFVCDMHTGVCSSHQSLQTHSRNLLLLNTSVFNLTGVCWTVCCLTHTTCATVHIHSFHKKYIFVYTEFTISYNRAVAGTSVWMDGIFFFFFMCVRQMICRVHQNTSNPLIIQPSHRIVFTSAAESRLLVYSGHQVSAWFSFAAAGPALVSAHACAVTPAPRGPCDVNCRKQQAC